MVFASCRSFLYWCVFVGSMAGGMQARIKEEEGKTDGIERVGTPGHPFTGLPAVAAVSYLGLRGAPLYRRTANSTLFLWLLSQLCFLAFKAPNPPFPFHWIITPSSSVSGSSLAPLLLPGEIVVLVVVVVVVGPRDVPYPPVTLAIAEIVWAGYSFLWNGPHPHHLHYPSSVSLRVKLYPRLYTLKLP